MSHLGIMNASSVPIGTKRGNILDPKGGGGGGSSGGSGGGDKDALIKGKTWSG